MDNFMDKLAQKLNAGEIIKANANAEAMEMRRMEAQLQEYEKIMQEVRKVNLKNAEVSDAVQKLAEESIQKIEALQAPQKEELNIDEFKADMSQMLEEFKKSVEESIQKSDEYVHSECVKVYRNVQAVVADGFKEQSEKREATETKLLKKIGSTKALTITTMVLIIIAMAWEIFKNILIFLV